MKILILSVEAGYGHRKAAESVAEEIKSRNLADVQVSVMDALDKTSASFKHGYVLLYHKMVAWAPSVWGFFFWFTDLKPVYFFVRPLRTLWNYIQSLPLQRFLIQENYDFILFTHFFPAEVAATLKRKGKLKSTLITVVTDIIPHYVWQNEGTDYYWTMAEEGKKVLVDRGANPDRVVTGGIPISKRFLVPYDREELQNRFHLDSNRFTVLFTSGSFGIGPTIDILETFKEIQDKVQAIVVCGMNQQLFQDLAKRRYPFPINTFGLIQNMPEVMSLCDLLLAKPGGATMCESLAKEIPMVIIAAIPGQEGYNADWLVKYGAAFKTKEPQVIVSIIKQYIEDDSFRNKVKTGIRKIKRPNAAKDLTDFILNHGKQ